MHIGVQIRRLDRILHLMHCVYLFRICRPSDGIIGDFSRNLQRIFCRIDHFSGFPVHNSPDSGGGQNKVSVLIRDPVITLAHLVPKRRGPCLNE